MKHVNTKGFDVIEAEGTYDDAQDKLIAEQAALAKAKADEREQCAKVCDRFQARDVGMQPAECAAAIRARGNT